MFFSSQIVLFSISPGFFAVGFSNPLQTPLIQNFILQSDSAKPRTKRWILQIRYIYRRATKNAPLHSFYVKRHRKYSEDDDTTALKYFIYQQTNTNLSPTINCNYQSTAIISIHCHVTEHVNNVTSPSNVPKRFFLPNTGTVKGKPCSSCRTDDIPTSPETSTLKYIPLRGRC